MASKPDRREYFKKYDAERKDDPKRKEKKRESDRKYRLRKKVEKLDICTKTIILPPNYEYIWKRLGWIYIPSGGNTPKEEYGGGSSIKHAYLESKDYRREYLDRGFF